MSAPFYAVAAFFIVAGGIAYLCDRWTKRHKPNRRRKGSFNRIPHKRIAPQALRYMKPGSL